MKRLIFSFLAIAACISGAVAQSASQIIERARIGATLQSTDLSGQISKGRNKTPVTLFLRNQDIQFTTGAGKERFHMRLGDGKHELFEMDDKGKQGAFPKGKLSQSIAGSDLTYEDLSLRFFYWPNPKLEGEERVDIHNCWKIRLNNPGKSGDYAVMYVWIHKEYGAFMKIEGFDRQGKQLKQFTVDEVMKLPDGGYTVKKVQVSSYKDGRRSGVSSLEFDKPKKAGPQGLR